MIGIALAYILLTIPLDGGDVIIQGGAYPQYGIPSTVWLESGEGWSGVSTPLGNIYAPGRFKTEEYRHLEQWLALGPWFLLSYAMTLGRPFEPYEPFSPEFMTTEGMWEADERRYHQWTVGIRDSGITIEFMKGWLP